MLFLELLARLFKTSMKRLISIILFLMISSFSFSQTDGGVTGQQTSQKPEETASGPKYSTPPKSKQSFMKRIYVGGFFGLSFGTSTSINLSPLIGYRITPDFNAGIGVLYNYNSFDYGPPIGKHGYSSWGGRLTLNYTFIDLITIGAEYQYTTVELYNAFENSFRDQGVNVLFLGGGIRQRVGRNAFVFIMVYYDVIQELYSPYDSVVFRIGAAAGI
jgi:hypothetical protein